MAGKLIKKDEAENTAVDMFGNPCAVPAHIGNQRRGSEEVSSEDTSLPRLSLIQDLSPQRKKTESAYIPGAEEGMIFNTATLELLGTEVTFIPVYFRKEYLLWANRDKVAGGGFAGAYASESLAYEAKDKLEDSDNYDVIDTHQQFGILVHPDHCEDRPHIEEVVISCSKTQMKPSRQLNTMVQQTGMDRFAKAYKMSAVQAKNAKGSFFNWSPRQMGYVPEHLFELAEKLYDGIKTGMKDVNRDYEGESTRVDDNDMGTENKPNKPVDEM